MDIYNIASLAVAVLCSLAFFRRIIEPEIGVSGILLLSLLFLAAVWNFLMAFGVRIFG